MSSSRAENYWAGKQVLVTGGLGFLGSNLVIKLLGLGARVTIVDAMIPHLGGNEFNIEPVKDDPRLRVNIGNIQDCDTMEHLVKGMDHIFHLASQVSHILGERDPIPDIQHNIVGTAAILQSCRINNPGVKLLYTGTRGQYGSAMKNPVAEDASLRPLGVHEATKLAAENFLLAYHRRHGIRCVLTRLTNIYGPRAQMKSGSYGVVNWFVRQALEGGTIALHGGGSYKRDFLFVDDCIQDLLQLAESEEAHGEVFNVGSDTVASYADIARLIIEIAGSGRAEVTDFTEERKSTEPGDIYLDVSKLKRTIDWGPRTALEEGLHQTIAFYQAHREWYF